MAKPGRRGIARIVAAAGYSWKGLLAAFRHEAAFRQELGLAMVLLPLGIWLGEDGVQRALLVIPVLLVLTVELLNSAVEAVVDRAGDEWNDLAGRAKDLGSAAVFVSLVLLVVVWGLVLGERLSV
ncbi:MAG: diacylglycerol kinase [Gammaproteobacteria bacterium]|nr:MAG: diacylglycerol kinase [Gammaproteobacteria bacterium]